MGEVATPRYKRLALRAAGWLEEQASRLQGKGFGAATTEQEVSAMLATLGRTPTLAVDIGGNLGQYTAALRAVAPELAIHVFEPSPHNLAVLREAFSGDTRITIVPAAVSDAAGSATLFANTPGSGLASLTKRRLDHFNIPFEHEDVVQTVRFEDYWREVLGSAPIDIVKIDVEGHELSVLRGFGAAIRATSVLQFEFGGCNIDTRTYFQDFWYYFKEHGFALYRISPLGLQKVAYYAEADEFFRTTNYIAVRQG